MSLDNRIKIQAKTLGADYCGVADLASARDFIEWQGGKLACGIPPGGGHGVVLLDTLVGSSRTGRLPRTRCSTGTMPTNRERGARPDGPPPCKHNPAGGLPGLPGPGIETGERREDRRIFSQTGSAHGRPWLDRPQLSPHHSGPRAPGAVDHDPHRCPPHPDRDSHGAPVREMHGLRRCLPDPRLHRRAVAEDEPREARFDAAACDRYFKAMESDGKPAACGMCLYICPYGQRQQARND